MNSLDHNRTKLDDAPWHLEEKDKNQDFTTTKKHIYETQDTHSKELTPQRTWMKTCWEYCYIFNTLTWYE